MIMMKKNILLYLLLLFLIIMNGFFLFKHFGKSDNVVPKRLGSANVFTDQLEFNEVQLNKFEELDRLHREKLKTIRLEISTYKEELFNKVSDENYDVANIETITTAIASKEKAKALATFRFLSSVSEICDQNQRKRFKEVIKKGVQSQSNSDEKRPPRGMEQKRRPPPPPRN